MADFNINEFVSELHKKNFGKNLLRFLLGALILAFAFNLFFDKYNVVPTGQGGLAMIINEMVPINTSILILIIGLVFLIIGLAFFGYDYAIKMMLITAIYPLFVSLTLLVTKHIDLEDTSIFLVMVIGGAMNGFGNGLIRNSGYSTGGFCSLYDVMHKYLHISIGVSTTIVNLILIAISGFTFGVESSIYALISLLVSSYVLDKVMIGISTNKVFYIITDKPFDVRDYINDKLGYDTTVIDARGGYTNKKKIMLMSVIPTVEYIKVKELVQEVDKNAFFLIVDTYESTIRKKKV